jgi:hypothetical protein
VPGVGSLSEVPAEDQRVRWVGPWARTHYKEMIVVRTLLAPGSSSSSVDGDWWGPVFAPFLVLDLWLLRGLVRYARTRGA